MAHIAETTEPAAMARLRAEVWPRIRARFASDLQPTPGVAEFLAALEAPCCVASASDPERIRFSLEATRLAKYFDGHMFSSHAVEHSKPAPDIFLYAAAQMGVAPTASVVIEDSTAPTRPRRPCGGVRLARSRRAPRRFSLTLIIFY